MLTPEQYIEEWEADSQLRAIAGLPPEWDERLCFDPSVVQDLPISPLDKQYLINVGLPKFLMPWDKLYFDLPPYTLPSLTEKFGCSPECQRYRLLGGKIMDCNEDEAELFIDEEPHYFRWYVCLDVEQNGRVVAASAEPGSDEPPWVDLYNSSLAQFAEVMLVLRHASVWLSQQVVEVDLAFKKAAKGEGNALLYASEARMKEHGRVLYQRLLEIDSANPKSMWKIALIDLLQMFQISGQGEELW